MKFIASFCLLFLFSTGMAQRTPDSSLFTLEVKVESDLPAVLKHFGRTHGIDFAYAPEMLAGEKVAPGSFAAATLDEVLTQLLAHTSLQYRIVAEDRVLVRRAAAGEVEAETTGHLTLSGQVTDEADDQPIPYVVLCLDTLNLAVLTGADGRFTLSLPAGLHDRQLIISRLGYRDTAIVAGALARQPKVSLQIDALQLAEVTVLDLLPSILPNDLTAGTRFSRSDAFRYQASQPAGADLFRTVQLLPGVSATDDLSAGLRIRGGNADETLILLDGIPIYQADHFYGIFSAVNSAYVEEVTLYKNTLPIEYSGRTAGMLLMASANEVKERSARAEANLLYAALQARAPLTESWGISLAGRTSYGNVASSRFFNWIRNEPDPLTASSDPENPRRRIIQTSPDFHFYDLNAKLLFRPNDRRRLSFNFFRSRDDFSNTYENRFRIRERAGPVANFESYRNEEVWANTGLSINYHALLPQDWTFQANAYYSGFRREGLVHSSLTQLRQGEARTVGFENQLFNQVRDWGGRLLLSRRNAQELGPRAGISFSGRQNAYELLTDDNSLWDGRPQSSEYTLFAEHQWEALPRWRLTLGGRLHHYDRTGQLYGSPLLQTRYDLSPHLSLKGAFSIQYQFVREITHETRLGQSMDLLLLSDGNALPVGRSANFMAGAAFRQQRWSLDLEFFHKDMAQVLEHASLFPGFRPEETRPSTRTDYRLFSGQGRITGLDAMLSYEHAGYSGWIAYTLSKLTHQFPEVRNNEPFPAQDDRRHQLKCVNALRLGRFDLSANLIYASGRPYTDLSRLVQAEDRRNLSPADRISYLPSYQRLDLGLAYNFPIKNSRMATGFSIFNLANRNNVKYLQYIYSIAALQGPAPGSAATVIGTETNLLDRTLNLFVNWRF